MYRHNRKNKDEIKTEKEHLSKLKKALQKNKGKRKKVKIQKQFRLYIHHGNKDRTSRIGDKTRSRQHMIR